MEVSTLGVVNLLAPAHWLQFTDASYCPCSLSPLFTLEGMTAGCFTAGSRPGGRA